MLNTIRFIERLSLKTVQKAQTTEIGCDCWRLRYDGRIVDCKKNYCDGRSFL